MRQRRQCADHAHCLAVLRPHQRLRQAVLEEQAVGQPGERVVLRPVGELVGQGLVLGRDRHELADRLEHRLGRPVGRDPRRVVDREEAQHLAAARPDDDRPAGGQGAVSSTAER